MFRVSQHPSSGVLKTVTATSTSGTGHNIGTATSLQRGLIGPRWREVAVLHTVASGWIFINVESLVPLRSGVYSLSIPFPYTLNLRFCVYEWSHFETMHDTKKNKSID